MNKQQLKTHVHKQNVTAAWLCIHVNMILSHRRASKHSSRSIQIMVACCTCVYTCVGYKDRKMDHAISTWMGDCKDFTSIEIRSP